VTGDTDEGERLLLLAENGIAAICMHTNWDAAPGGVNDLLAEAVGLVPPYAFLGPSFTHEDGRRYGLGRTGYLDKPCDAVTLARRLKQRLGCPGIRMVPGNRDSRFVAVGSGASGSQFDDVQRLGCDTFVTGDVKYSLFLTAHARGVTLIDAGHFYTENIIVASMAQRLREAAPDISVSIAQTAGDPTIWL
jgi:putative NIF3 family GTP cyclohydrolase 1 type 2